MPKRPRGFLKLVAHKPAEFPSRPAAGTTWTCGRFQQTGQPQKVYPGSPFIIQRVLQERDRDKLKLFELHPTDTKTLTANIAQLEAGRQVAILRKTALKASRNSAPAHAPCAAAVRPQLRA